MKLDYIEQGDCLNLLRNLPEGSVDLTVTSPPYDNLRTYNGFSWDFEATARELLRVTKQGGVVVWIVNDATVKGSETGTSFRQALYFKECGFNLHDTMIWDKQAFTATGSLAVRYAPVFEYMFILSKGKPKTFNPIKDIKNKYAGRTLHGTIRQKDGGFRPASGAGKKKIAAFGQRHNVWHMTCARGKKDRSSHPAPFPEQLAADHIISWSNEGDVVLDPFIGSGTTAVAAKNLGRHYIGFDISEEYCDMARKRVADVEVEEEV